MKKKASVLFLLCLIGSTLLGEDHDKINLSPIQEYWNSELQQLNILFSVENRTHQAVDLSVIVIVKNRQKVDKRGIVLPTITRSKTGVFSISFKPDTMEVDDTIEISVNLFGKSFKGYLDQTVHNLKITEIKESDSFKVQPIFANFRPTSSVIDLAPDLISSSFGEMLAFSTVLATKRVSEVTHNILADEKKKWKINLQHPRWSLITDPTEDDYQVIKLVYQSPQHQAQEVKSAAGIELHFSQNIDPKSIDYSSMYVFSKTKGVSGKKIEGEFTVKKKKVYFTPKKELDDNTFYQVVVNDKLRSIRGDGLRKTISWQFKTSVRPKIKTVSKPAIKVRRVDPKPNATGIQTDYRVAVYLGSLIDEKTVTDQTLSLFHRGQRVPGKIKTKRGTIELIPKKKLKRGAKYSVVLNNDFRDIKSVQLKRKIKWSFETRPKIDYPEADDPDILIFSPSHEMVSYTKEKKGVLKLGITAFDPLIHVDVNGKKIKLPIDSKVNFEIPFQLKKKSTLFEISTYTNKGKAIKKFVVNYGRKPSGKSPFQIVIIGAYSSTDNLDNSSSGSDKVIGDKLTVTVVPKYDFDVGENSIFRLKGVVLRDQYTNSDYKSKETAYTQIASEWVEKKTPFGEITGGVGYNFILTENSGFMGKTEISEETVFYGKSKHQVNKKTSWEVGLDYKNKNFKAEADDVDNETDATEIKITGKYRFTWADIKNSPKIGYTINDAVGKYQDSTTLTVGTTLTYPIGDFEPSFGYSHQQVKKNTASPITEDKAQQKTTATMNIKVKYKLFPKGFLTMGYKNKEVNSNISNSSYKNNTTSLSYMHIF